jgi:thiol-disulfide isomerase/thioredoxin
MSDLKGKLIIFDFLSSTCLSCIRELPKLHSLQEKYAQDIQIIVVSSEPFSKLKWLFDKNRIAADKVLPFFYSDRVLGNLFPHRIFPHKVWVSPAGKVAAITESAQLTTENIQIALKEMPLHLPVKRDVTDYDITQPLFGGNNQPETTTKLFRSILTTYIPGMVSGSKQWEDQFNKKYTWFNMSVLSLYQHALHFPANRIVLEVSDQNNYYSREKGKLFCYEQTFPATLSDKAALQLMANDLNNYLDLHGRIEKRKQVCYALQIIDTAKIPGTKGTKPFIQAGGQYNERLFLNQPVSMLIAILNSQIVAQKPKPIVIDETGYKGKMDLKLAAGNLNDFQQLNLALYPFGMTLKRVERELDVFVLTENNNASQLQSLSTY